MRRRESGLRTPTVRATGPRRVSSQTFVKRVVGLPGDTLKIIDGNVYPQRRQGAGLLPPALHRPAGTARFSQTITFPSRRLLHDGRQPRRLRRQPLLGTRTAALDHRDRVLHLLAAPPHRHPLRQRSDRAGDRDENRPALAGYPARRESGSASNQPSPESALAITSATTALTLSLLPWARAASMRQRTASADSSIARNSAT